MIYRCRTVKPEESAWADVEADSPEEAANDFHFQRDNELKSLRYWDDKVDSDGIKTTQIVLFAEVEVEGFQTWISRVYKSGIFRRGGVKTGVLTLFDIAKQLDYKHEPKTLLDVWEAEEDWEFG